MNSRRTILIIPVLLMLVASCVTSSRPTAVWSSAKTIHTIGTNSHLSLLWERPIYTAADIFGNPCATLDESLFVIGSEQSQGNLHILAIDQEGKTKWSQEGDFSLTHSDTQLFVGNGSTVAALSPKNGDINWSTDLSFVGAVIDLFYFDNKLFASGSRFPYAVISPNDGKVLKEYSSVDSFRSNYPHVPFFADVTFQPVVLGEDAIFQFGKILYTFQRSKLTANNLVWEIAADSISNATLIDDLFFYIAKDDKLKTISASTGELLYETSIEPSIDFFNYEKDVQHAGYYVCSDVKNRVLYVILGDSRQLFALSVAK